MLDNDNEYAYVYVFALPYYTNRISVNSEHYLTNVRLLSVAPPQALRPYYQEGFLIGEDEFSETYTNKDELDLNNRLVAKFKFKNTKEFWGDSEKALTREDLYPKDDEIEALCKEVSNELYDVIASRRNANISGDQYFAFMKGWIAIEKLLFEYMGRFTERQSLSSAGFIKMIDDNDLRKKLHRARVQRNYLAHNVDSNTPIKEFFNEEDLKDLYDDLYTYFEKYGKHH